MPLVAWLTISAYVGGAMIGFLNCDAYQNWLAKSEAEQAAIIEAAAETAETEGAESPEIIIITG